MFLGGGCRSLAFSATSSFKAYAAIAEAEGPRFDTAQAAIAESYARNVSDEFVVPSIIGGYRGMTDGDGVLCFNFRADRVREILPALLDPDFSAFPLRRAIDIAAAAIGPMLGKQQTKGTT